MLATLIHEVPFSMDLLDETQELELYLNFKVIFYPKMTIMYNHIINDIILFTFSLQISLS